MATMEQSLNIHAIAVRGVRCPLCESTNIRSSRYLDTDGPVRRSVLAAHRCWRCGTRLYSVKRPVRHALSVTALATLCFSFSVWQEYAEAAATVRPEGRLGAELYARADTAAVSRWSARGADPRVENGARATAVADGDRPQWTGMRHALQARADAEQPARVGDPEQR